MTAEKLYQLGIELRSAALPGHRDRRVDSRAAMINGHDIGEIHEARHQLNVPALHADYPFAVPALEALLEAPADIVAQLEAPRQRVGGEPVTAQVNDGNSVICAD